MRAFDEKGIEYVLLVEVRHLARLLAEGRVEGVEVAFDPRAMAWLVLGRGGDGAELAGETLVLRHRGGETRLFVPGLREEAVVRLLMR